MKPLARQIRPSDSIISIDLRKVIVDTRVQRLEGLDQRRASRMAANFDPAATGVIIVSERPDGALVVLDGMHRSTAAIEAGVTTLLARVFTGLTLADEARLFSRYNDSKSVSAISRFRAEVTSGDPAAVEMDDIVNRHGWAVMNGQATGHLTAITAARKVYEKGAGALAPAAYPDLFDKTLAVITEAWGHDESATHAAIIGGVGLLFARFGEAVDVAKLVREMQQTTPLRLVGQARTLRELQQGTVDAALAKLLVGMHNKQKRTNALPDWTWTR